MKKYAILLILPLLMAASVIPKPVRDTDYVWRCYGADAGVITETKHNEEADAYYECQVKAEANPGKVYYAEGAVYKFLVPAVTPPPPPPPPPPTGNEPTLNGWLVHGWKVPTGSLPPEIPTTTHTQFVVDHQDVSYGPTSAAMYLSQLGLGNYIIRGRKLFNLAQGTYSIQIASDDGVRVWVGSNQIVNDWINQSMINKTVTFVHAGGIVEIKVEHYARSGVAGLSISAPVLVNAPPPPPPPVVNVPTLTGWLVEGWKIPAVSSAIPVVPTGSPLEIAVNRADIGYPQSTMYLTSLGEDFYFIRGRKLYNLAAGNYTMTVASDDGVRIWVGANQIFNEWKDQWMPDRVVNFTHAGGIVEIKVEHYENEWGASLKVTDPIIFVAPPPPPPPVTGVGGIKINNVAQPTENIDETAIRIPLRWEVAYSVNSVEVTKNAIYSGTTLIASGVPQEFNNVKMRVVDTDNEYSDWTNVDKNLVQWSQ